ncbi:MAG: hypothetical protein N2517_04650 [Ignavibacteria bacterium]|nr:hypothetical protein [Ignavibacteria bacterium]
MDIINRLLDLLMFRLGVEENYDGKVTPIVTTGSIVWGILLRSAIILFFSFIVMELIENRKYWWISLLFLWLFAAYPGWKQYQFFKKKIQDVEESTLCGKCVHFDSTSQLCKLYDEHVAEGYIPCEGVDWEPKSENEDVY